MLITVVIIAVFSTYYLLFWYQDAIWGPRKKQQLMQRKPLVELQAWGFAPVTNAFVGELRGKAAMLPLAYVGNMRGYATEVSFGWTEQPHILVRVFFDPLSRDYDAVILNWKGVQATTKSWRFGELFSCAPVYIDARLSYNIWPPSAEKIIDLAEQMVCALDAISLARIPYAEACALAEYVLATSKSRGLSVEQK